MSWAARRRLQIVLGICIAIAVIVALALYFSLHRAPSCADRIQNEGEAGIDCGGPCPYLCESEVESPVVRFTQEFPGVGSSTDAIAYVDNPNQDAFAQNVSYTLSLYDAKSDLVAAPSGTFDLAPGATTPVFVANIPTGSAHASSAFLAIASSSLAWQAAGSPAVMPSVGSAILSGSANNPRITATLSNPAAVPFQNIVVIAALFDASGNIITASQTLLQTIPAQGSAQAVFTWNAPFAKAPAHIDVLPVPTTP